jgi:type I restriction enzyme S subunit
MGFEALARGRKASAVDAGPVEGPWDLPAGWRWERLGDLVEKSSAKHHPDKESNLPFVGLEQIPPHEMRIEGVGSFADMRSAGSAFLPGDVLYGRLRPYLNKVWVADRKGACSGELLVLRPKAGMDARYLALNLHSQRYVYYASHIVTGDRPRIDFDLMGAFPVPVPDDGTQRQIVARIDALFAEIDEGEAALAEARAGVETYRKALLKAAVIGELTADWRAANPPQETGEQLLQRILADRRARWRADPKNARKKYTEPAGPDTEGLPDVPDGWVWAGFDMLFETKSDGGLKTREKEYLSQGAFPIIDQGAKPVAGYSNDPNMIQPHQLPVILFGDHSRRFKLVDFPFCIGADGIKIISPHRLMNVDFLMSSLLAANFEDRGYSRHYQFVRALAFGVPSLSEQEFIASIVTDAMRLAGVILLEISQAESAASTLRQSILAAAFRGDLAT